MFSWVQSISSFVPSIPPATLIVWMQFLGWSQPQDVINIVLLLQEKKYSDLVEGLACTLDALVQPTQKLQAKERLGLLLEERLSDPVYPSVIWWCQLALDKICFSEQMLAYCSDSPPENPPTLVRQIKRLKEVLELSKNGLKKLEDFKKITDCDYSDLISVRALYLDLESTLRKACSLLVSEWEVDFDLLLGVDVTQWDALNSKEYPEQLKDLVEFFQSWVDIEKFGEISGHLLSSIQGADTFDYSQFSYFLGQAPRYLSQTAFALKGYFNEKLKDTHYLSEGTLSDAGQPVCLTEEALLKQWSELEFLSEKLGYALDQLIVNGELNIVNAVQILYVLRYGFNLFNTIFTQVNIVKLETEHIVFSMLSFLKYKVFLKCIQWVDEREIQCAVQQGIWSECVLFYLKEEWSKLHRFLDSLSFFDFSRGKDLIELVDAPFFRARFLSIQKKNIESLIGPYLEPDRQFLIRSREAQLDYLLDTTEISLFFEKIEPLEVLDQLHFFEKIEPLEVLDQLHSMLTIRDPQERYLACQTSLLFFDTAKKFIEQLERLFEGEENRQFFAAHYAILQPIFVRYCVGYDCCIRDYLSQKVDSSWEQVKSSSCHIANIKLHLGAERQKITTFLSYTNQDLRIYPVTNSIKSKNMILNRLLEKVMPKLEQWVVESINFSDPSVQGDLDGKILRDNLWTLYDISSTEGERVFSVILKILSNGFFQMGSALVILSNLQIQKSQDPFSCVWQLYCLQQHVRDAVFSFLKLSCHPTYGSQEVRQLYSRCESAKNMLCSKIDNGLEFYTAFKNGIAQDISEDIVRITHKSHSRVWLFLTESLLILRRFHQVKQYWNDFAQTLNQWEKKCLRDSVYEKELFRIFLSFYYFEYDMGVKPGLLSKRLFEWGALYYRGVLVSSESNFWKRMSYGCMTDSLRTHCDARHPFLLEMLNEVQQDEDKYKKESIKRGLFDILQKKYGGESASKQLRYSSIAYDSQLRAYISKRLQQTPLALDENEPFEQTLEDRYLKPWVTAFDKDYLNDYLIYDEIRFLSDQLRAYGHKKKATDQLDGVFNQINQEDIRNIIRDLRRIIMDDSMFRGQLLRQNDSIWNWFLGLCFSLLRILNIYQDPVERIYMNMQKPFKHGFFERKSLLCSEQEDKFYLVAYTS